MEQTGNAPNYLKCGLCNHFVKNSRKSDLIEHFKSAHKVIKLDKLKCEKRPYDETSTSEKLAEPFQRSHSEEKSNEHELQADTEQDPADQGKHVVDVEGVSMLDRNRVTRNSTGSEDVGFQNDYERICLI